MSKANPEPTVSDRILAAARRMRATNQVGYVDGTPYYTGAELEELVLDYKLSQETIDSKNSVIEDLRIQLERNDLVARILDGA